MAGTRLVSTTRDGYHQQIRHNLLGRKGEGLLRVDIASFRIGSHPKWIEFLASLATLPTPVSLRLLVGVNPDPDLMLGVKRTTRKVYTEDGCIGTLEQLDHLTQGRLQIRILDDFHTKMWIFTRRNGASTALVGSRNLNLSGWHELMIEVGGAYIPPLSKAFEKCWLKAVEPPAIKQRKSGRGSSFIHSVLKDGPNIIR